MVLHGIVCHGVVCYGMVNHGIAFNGMVCHGMICQISWLDCSTVRNITDKQDFAQIAQHVTSTKK